MNDLVEKVFAAVTLQFPEYPLTKPVVRATILATLKAIGEPTETMFAAGRDAEPFMTPAGEKPWTPGQIVASTVWREMLQALVAEVAANRNQRQRVSIDAVHGILRET